ncbi:MAG: transcriptional repressor [Actinobacteria bacterium]|nr:transcriptional repressor [Actinomycetota bacterium]
MTDSAAWREEVKAVLRHEGKRSGGAREAVVDALAGHDCCVSAQEIADELRGGESRVGLASVYRALELLHGEGLVQRVDLGGGGYRYEPILPGGEHHHHVVCDRCGEVTAFEDPTLERAIERMERRLRRVVSAHDVVLHADCRRCAARA